MGDERAYENVENRSRVKFVSLEQMVLADHLLRQIDAAIDFNKIYEFAGNLYCKDNGHPSIDPVVPFIRSTEAWFRLPTG